HPVASFGHKEPGVIGRNTLDGLTFLLSLALRSNGERRRTQVARLSAELGIHPTPEYGLTPGGRSDAEVPLDLAPPAGWRHEPDPLPDLHPLWAHAYHDLGRTLLRERLDVMLDDHPGQPRTLTEWASDGASTSRACIESVRGD
ncbi:hypothetical protein, partial [Streptomyces sp. NRRL S-1448]|uniref:hypothetical protein n=1 Tax=Streptomyces sp. NRRL S-1448 TaxID=1463883 RepID=UPI00131BB616